MKWGEEINGSRSEVVVGRAEKDVSIYLRIEKRDAGVKSHFKSLKPEYAKSLSRLQLRKWW